MRARLLWLGLWLGLLLVTVPSAAASARQVATPRGEPIEVLVEYPARAVSKSLPTVVLAPGAGYHMRLPLLESLARALVKQGIVVYRFNWAYFVKDPEKGTLSKDRLAEIEDMNTVLELARRDPAVDKSRIALAGKSLGSIIAWRVLRSQPDVRGALLLTPVCSSRPNKPVVPEANYPEVAQETRRSAWILGDEDPACVPPTLFRLLASSGQPTRVNVVGGNHSFEHGPPGDKAAAASTSRTVELVTRLSVEFLETALR
jgi:dienelactone hydrolase